MTRQGSVVLLGVVAAGFGGAAEFDVALVFELFEPAFDGSLRFVTSRNKCCCVQAGRLSNDQAQGFWTIYSATYSATYSAIYSDIYSATYSDIYALIYANGRCIWEWLRLE